MPFVGAVGCTDGRDGFDFDLGDGRVLNPDLRCAAAFVNDAYGAHRDSKSKSRLKSRQNVEFKNMCVAPPASAPTPSTRCRYFRGQY